MKIIMSCNWFLADLSHSALFGPQFSFIQHFEQRNCTLPRFFAWHTVIDDLSQMVVCFYTV